MSSSDDLKESNHVEEAMYGRVGTSDCHKVGIMGGCGFNCWVYQDGRCPEPDEMTFETPEEEVFHIMLYSKKAGESA